MINNNLTKQRSCIGCKTKNNKYDFLRIVFDGNKLVIDDSEQKMKGRGCYLCHNKECLTKAFKRNAFNYRLKQKLSREELEKFREELENRV